MSGYYPPEVIPFALCGAVLDIVLEHNEEAKKLYDRIKEYCGLPGCKETFDRIAGQIQGRKSLLKAIVKKSGYDFKKPPDEKNHFVYTRGLLRGGTKYAFSYVKKNWLWIRLSFRRWRDFKRLAMSVNDFIIVGFNNKDDLRKGKRKVTANSSNTLVETIMFRAFAEIYKVDIDVLGNMPYFQRGKRIFGLAAIVGGKIPVRARNVLVGRFIKAGFSLKHDYKLKIGAWRWYQCRVVCSGPQEYYQRQLKETTPSVYPYALKRAPGRAASSSRGTR